MRNGDPSNNHQGLPLPDQQELSSPLVTIPLTDPHQLPDNPSLGDLVKDATTQISTLVRAEVTLARTEITRDIKQGLTGSIYFLAALSVLLYSTLFFFFFLAELLDEWLKRWAAYLIVFGLMVAISLMFALLGVLRVRKVRGPRQTIHTLQQARDQFIPSSRSSTSLVEENEAPINDPSGW